MSRATKSTQTLLDRSHPVAGWSNASQVFSNDLYYYSVTLYRAKDGRYFVRQWGGPAVVAAGEVKWLSEEDAKTFIRVHAQHPITGYGFTETEIAELMGGGDPRGTRVEPEPRRPSFWSL